jgi:peptide/nickel transport system substrate-binding protein
VDRRDRAVAGGLALALAVIVAALAAPALLPVTGRGSAASPSPSATAAAVYREGLLGRLTSVNPLTARTDADRSIVSLVFSGLLRLGPDDTLRPDLARWWRAEEDGTAWVVRIADDATWHDGEPVTAEDVAFTARALADPLLAAPQGPSWSNVTVQTIDEKTVRFVLSEPFGGFPWLLTQPLAPAHLLSSIDLDAIDDDPFAREPVGTGPFRVVRWDPTSATLQALQTSTLGEPAEEVSAARPSRPRPLIAGLQIEVYRDAGAMAGDLERGVLDGAVGLPGPGAEGVAGPIARQIVYPGTTLSTIQLNLRPDHKELRDARVRTALLAAIDRDHMIAATVGGPAERAESPIPPSSSLFDLEASVPVAHDPKAAAKLLKDAGWTRLRSGGWAAPGSSKQYALTILAPPVELAPRLVEGARLVAADWVSLGIKASVEEVDFRELVERLHGGDFGAAIVDVAIGQDPDLYPLLASSQVVSDGLNASGVQDAKLDKLLVAARRASDEDARKRAYSELQRYLAKNRYLLTLYFADVAFTVSNRLEGPVSRQLAQAGDRYWDVLTWRLASGR